MTPYPGMLHGNDITWFAFLLYQCDRGYADITWNNRLFYDHSASLVSIICE